ncbi:MAG: hypothetical protein IK103_05315 [Bacteroidales bacterium]|nr:hypothetical protein [Bacteroidales bacterium]
MKRIIIALAILLALPFSAISQSKFAVNPEIYNFTEVFMADSPFRLGILGKEYKRLQIYYESVTRQSSDTYRVKGYSNAAGNVCPFEGTIKIVSITTQNPEEFEADHSVYLLKASYSFKETGGIGTGTFSGTADFDFWIHNKTPLIEDGMLGADGYCNSQYTGVWTSDKTKTKKIANWGSCRIPDCGDLDQGVGEFIPSEKYHAKGWADYFNSIYGKTDETRANAFFSESSRWWVKTDPILVFKQTPKPVISVYRKSAKNVTTPGALIQTLSLKSDVMPEYRDINDDGCLEVFQVCDDGLMFVWSPKDGKFYNVPSYNFVKYRGNLCYYKEIRKFVTTHYDNDTQAHYFYMYYYSRGNDPSQDAIVFEGSVTEKDGIWTELNQYGQILHNKVNTPEKLSKVWNDYIRLSMAL